MLTSKRLLLISSVLLTLLVGLPALVWVGLTYQPSFYREKAKLPPAKRKQEARLFVAQSMQLRNDIMNEPHWDAVFTDEQVNSWLAEDLVAHFADQLPAEVHEPRVVFEDDRATLAFQLDQGPMRSVVWVVVRPRMAGENVLALSIEKIRAGVVPIPAEKILDKITAHAAAQGLDLRWEKDGDIPVALIHYHPQARRRDIVLERLEVREGLIRLSGRSHRSSNTSAAVMTLPSRRMLQTTFPRRNVQSPPKSGSSGPLSCTWNAPTPLS